MKEIECNCPCCTKTSMDDGKVYRCSRYNAIVGSYKIGQPSITPQIIQKVFDGEFANEVAIKEIEQQINIALNENR